MLTTRKRVQVPFLFRAADGLGANGKLIARSYGTEIEGVFARAGAAYEWDENNFLYQVPHSLPRLSVVRGQPALLLEGIGVNYALYSRAFDNAVHAKTNVTVTPDQAYAPDGTVTMDKVEATGTAATKLEQTLIFTPSTTRATFRIFARIGSGATDANQFEFRSVGGTTARRFISINYATGVITDLGSVGVGSARAVLRGLSWEITLSISGFTAATEFAFAAAFTGSTEAAGEYAYLWEAHVGVSEVETSSVITTAGASATRELDSLYFPFAAPPKEATIYARFMELGLASGGTNEGILSLGASANPSIMLLTGGAGSYYGLNRQGSDVASGVPSGTPAPGDIVELRLLIASTGALTLGQSLNGGTETVSTASPAQALPGAWDYPRLYIGSRGSGTQPGTAGFRDVCLEFGTKSLAEMRALAEVN